MIMAGVAMGSNYNLKAVAPHFFCKLHADCVSRFCIDLISLKRLISMIAKSPIALTPKAFSSHELLCCCILCAVDGDRKIKGCQPVCIHKPHRIVVAKGELQI